MSTDIPGATARGQASSDRAAFHVYGSKGALTIEAGSRTRARDTQYVIHVEAAAASGLRTYDWKNKINFMLLPDELPALLSVLMGLLVSTRFANHGQAANKSLELHHQGAHLFAKLAHAQRLIAVPVMPEDALRLAALVTRQMTRCHGDLGRQEILTLTRLVYAPMKAKASPPDGSNERGRRSARNNNPVTPP